MYDPELPNGFQDADFEMRDLEAAGRRAAALHRKGICTHGWRQGRIGANNPALAQAPEKPRQDATIPAGCDLCLHCGQSVPEIVCRDIPAWAR